MTFYQPALNFTHWAQIIYQKYFRPFIPFIRLSIKVVKGAPKKAAKAEGKGFALPSFSLPSFGRDDEEEEVTPKWAFYPGLNLHLY